jgi:hypothetical protein
VPSFLISAGARLTVMRSSGKVYPELLMAALTRSRLSFTAASGKPTVVIVCIVYFLTIIRLHGSNYLIYFINTSIHLFSYISQEQAYCHNLLPRIVLLSPFSIFTILSFFEYRWNKFFRRSQLDAHIASLNILALQL